MPASFNNDGKPAYMYDSVGDTWYAFGGKIDTASAYEWTNTQTYLNDVTFDDSVVFLDGFNNFLNETLRDAAITSPVQGTLCFLRQTTGGSPLNQIQYYSGSAWVAVDADITGVTASTGLTGGGTSGTASLAVDTTVVATTNNSLTMTGKTLTTPTITLSTTSSTTEGQIAWDSTNDKILVGDGTNTKEFASSTLTLNAQTGTTYTFVLADKDKLVTASNAAAQTYSIPTNASVTYPVGTQINIIQIGAGQVTIQAASSGTTTVSSTGATPTAPALRAQYSSATLIKAATDLWYVVGDIS